MPAGGFGERVAKQPPPSKQPRHDGADGDLQDLGHLSIREARDVREHNGLSVDEGQREGRLPYLFQENMLERRVFLPHDRAGRASRCIQIVDADNHVRPSLFGPTQKDGPEDGKHPHLRGRGVPELIQGPKRPEAGLLNQIFGILDGADQPQSCAIQRCQVRSNVLVESPGPGGIRLVTHRDQSI
jgi:hypothetical protein